ncbi:MAG: hypothetical protein JO264_10070 [Acidisphaera sp.]|nr:hypothetical protein [Acidisphaera sp.]
MAFDPEAAATALHEARRARQPIAQLDAAIGPRDEAEGAAVQLCLARRFGVQRPGGFKIGATGRRMQQYLGLSGPAAGFMPEAGIRRSGAALHYADLVAPGVECELAVRLARDLPPGPCDRERARAAVGALFAAIEVVENRYVGGSLAFGTPWLIADQVFHAAAVLGEPEEDWRGLDLVGLAGRITVDGETAGEGVGGELLGHPLEALAWLAGSEVARVFGGLFAGQVVMLGSVTPPVWLQGPASVVVSFPPLAEARVRLE